MLTTAADRSHANTGCTATLLQVLIRELEAKLSVHAVGYAA